MAVYLNNNNTHLHGFDRLSQSLLISSECKIENANEDDPRQRFQDTVPLDSPLMDDQSGNLDLDTLALDDSDCDDHGTNDRAFECEEEEIVLDSDDEEINGSRLVVVTKTSADSVAEKRINADRLGTNSNASIYEQRYAGNGVLLMDAGNVKGLDDLPDCDRELARVNETISIEEPDEWSPQVDALGFVDNFVSINKVDLSQGTGYRKAFRERSPVVSGASGPQHLARKLNMQTQAKGKGTFEWVSREGMETSGKDMRLASDFGCCERKGASNLNEDTRAGSDHLGSGFAVRSAKDRHEMKEISGANIANDLELRGKHSEDDATVRDTLVIYDVGFNTQIAAEAIEALAYTHPFAYSSVDACQDMEKAVNHSLRSSAENNSQLKHTSVQTSVCNDIGDILKSAKRKKRSERKFGRGISSSSKKQPVVQELHPELTTRLVKRSKWFAEAQLYSGSSANLNESSGIGHLKPIERNKEGSNTTVDNNMIPLTTFGTSLLADVQSKGQSEKVSPLTQQIRKQGSAVWSKAIGNEASNQREKTNGYLEHNFVVYKRKRSHASANPLRFSSNGDSSKLCDSSEEARKSNLTSLSNLSMWKYPREKMNGSMEHGVIVYRRQRSCMNSNRLRVSSIGGSSKLCDSSDGARKSVLNNFSKLGMWNYPRGKRTRRNVRKHINRTFDLKALFNSRCRKECGRSISSTISMGLGSTSPAISAEKNHTSIASADKTAELPTSECAAVSSKIGKNVISSNHKPCDYYKRPHNKDVPKPFLIKELTNLGFPEHIPEFQWKELRKRKDFASVCILFSQHLDEDILKHQKKVAARLGMSIVSCSTDATHFIADKFLRTKNMLEAIALGKQVVTHLWLESCGQANCFIDEKNYILRDSKKEKEFGFCMPVSLAWASQQPLLKGRRVFITPSIKPSKEMIMSLVKAVHGQLVEKVQISTLEDKDVPKDPLILSCKEDHSICLPFIQRGVAVFSSELLLNGIVTQKLEYKRHQLFATDVKKNCS